MYRYKSLHKYRSNISSPAYFFFTQLTYMLVIAIFGYISEFSTVEGKCSPILVLVMDY